MYVCLPSFTFPANTRGEVDLLEESQLFHESLRFLIGVGPTGG